MNSVGLALSLAERMVLNLGNSMAASRALMWAEKLVPRLEAVKVE